MVADTYRSPKRSTFVLLEAPDGGGGGKLKLDLEGGGAIAGATGDGASRSGGIWVAAAVKSSRVAE